MDANGTRFCLLLGDADWLGCAVESGRVEWDARHAELALHRVAETLAASPGDAPVQARDRRGVAADRFGNIYWIDATRAKVLVRSAGSSRVATFWPPERDSAPERHGDFESAAAPAPIGRTFAGATVTDDHYLVVGSAEPGGILVFDLVSGGPPLEMAWPALDPGAPFVPLDLAPRAQCGAWILDTAQRYWELDGRFAVVMSRQDTVEIVPPREPEFAPVGRAPASSAPRVFPAGHLLDAASPIEASNPVAIEALPTGEILILDAGAEAAPSCIVCYRDGELIGEFELDFHAHDFVYFPAEAGEAVPDLLVVASSGGNQSFAYEIQRDPGGVRFERRADLYPMRRFGGKGLVRVHALLDKTAVFYDFGDTWVPLVRQPRVRYDTEATLVTRVWDSGELGCVWHRVTLDARIAPGASMEIWSRAADTTDGVSIDAPWRKEPSPYLRGTGSELPWAAAWPGRRANTPLEPGEGTWELLFQEAKGRYVQLRLVLRGDARVTPRLRALRAWYPRYSFLERYLPAVYREDAVSASFFERFLANFEGTLTAIEDRVTAVQALFDVRSAPGDALQWLADWFGVAIDPAWDERRRRLFIRHAMDFFQYRGTVHGLKMALHLAFDDCIGEEDLGPPATGVPRLNDIRIVENYLLRKRPAVALGEPQEFDGPRVVAGSDAQRDEARDALLRSLGPVPADGGAERSRWQRYLESKYVGIAGVNASHGTAYPGFDAIVLPADEPSRKATLEDWQGFITATQSSRDALARVRWQDFLARRYRRIGVLNGKHGTGWSSFDWIALPDKVPAQAVLQDDWLQFELRAEPMYQLAHTFRVLLPTPSGGLQPAVAKERMDLAQRIVNLEKPAHTAFDVRFFWALFRVGDARLGFDTLLDAGSRAPQLLADTLVGRSFVGASFVAGNPANLPRRHMALAC